MITGSVAQREFRMRHRSFRATVLLFLFLFFFVLVHAHAEVPEDALRATVRIFSGSESGTGFFVVVADEDGTSERHLLVTAAHVFNNTEGDKCTVVFRAPRNEGRFIRMEAELAIRDGEKQLWLSHPEVDVAVIAMDLLDGIDIKAFRYDQIGPASFAEDRKIRVGQDVCIPCFPAKTEGNSAGWPVLRRGSIATHPLTPLAEAKTMFVDYSHFGGDSGAPVVASIGDEAIVVGLVIAMQRQTDRSVMPLEERTVHTSLSLAIAVQSPFVRETIDRWQNRE